MKLRPLLILVALASSLVTASMSYAQVPPGSTGQCKDATYTSAASKQGACSGHGGVKEWYGQGNTTGTSPTKSTAPAKSTTSTQSTTSTTSTVPAQAPAGSTGQCKDATYTSAASKRGACSGHGGVKEWYGQGNTTQTPSKATAPAVPTTTAPTTTAPTTTAPTTTAPAKPTGTQAAPAGGAGKVWVNTASHVYHCANDQWYGKTKQGEYMSEADAIAKGNRASKGKPCS